MSRTRTLSKTSFSDILRTKLEITYDLQQLNTMLPSKEYAAFWYRNYLLVTYTIIRSSVPLMQSAYNRCLDYKDEREFVTRLGKYYKKHSLEELHHDEWLLDDLESTGVSRQESLTLKPYLAVAELVGSQYYWIYHWHPVCLLGYIAFLEGNPPTQHLISKLQKITGFPDTSFRTLIKHSNLDPHHRDELFELLKSLPLTAKHECWVTSNALYSANKLRK